MLLIEDVMLLVRHKRLRVERKVQSDIIGGMKYLIVMAMEGVITKMKSSGIVNTRPRRLSLMNI